MKIGFVSDIHEDITRLKEALEILKREECDEIVCLGDVVGYSVPYYAFLSSRSGHEVIKMLKQNCGVIVVGNHDLFAICKLPQHNAGFSYPKEWYSLDYQTRKELSQGRIPLYEEEELPSLLSKEDEAVIDTLPEYVVKEYGKIKILFSHYAFPNLAGTTTFQPRTVEDVADHFDFMRKHDCTLAISGHDHQEGIMIFTEKSVSEVLFDTIIKLTDRPTWLHGPSVVNGGLANGVMILDLDTMEIRAVPLNSKKHVAPEWRKL